MSKEFTKEDVIQNKKDAIKALNRLLECYINDSTGSAERHLKKANLISFWLKDFVRYVNFEENFEPTRNIAYKRGDIVKINFGFNIGSEYGGLHYAVVLDKKNAHNSPVVTVIPLTSLKKDKEIHHNSVELGNNIFRSLNTKLVTTIKNLEERQNDIHNSHESITALLSIVVKTIDKLEQVKNPTIKDLQEIVENGELIKKIQQMQDELEQNIRENEEKIKEFKKLENEVSRMKKGSVALVNQITTISKLRIVDPQKTNDVLSGISLPGEIMEKINEKLKELYV